MTRTLLVAAFLFLQAIGLNGEIVSRIQKDKDWVEKIKKLYVNEQLPVGEQVLPLEQEVALDGLMPLDELVVGSDSFTWKDCGDNAPVVVESVKISPEVIQIPGNLTVSFKVLVKEDATAPIKAEVEIAKKFGFDYIPLPCVDNVGSCTYDDACALNPFNNATKCPQEFIDEKIPCKCPFPKGTYTVQDVPIAIPKVDASLPLSGDYKLTLKTYKGSKEFGCLQSTFQIKESS